MVLSSLSISWCNRTASVNIIYTDSSVTPTASENKFPLTVLKSGQLVFFHWRAVTETVSDNLWVSWALSSFLLVTPSEDSTKFIINKKKDRT